MVQENGEEELPETYKMAALRQLLVGDIKRHVQLREEDLRVYADLRQCVMRWALTKKLERDRKGKDEMDTTRMEEDCGKFGPPAKECKAGGVNAAWEENENEPEAEGTSMSAH